MPVDWCMQSCHLSQQKNVNPQGETFSSLDVWLPKSISAWDGVGGKIEVPIQHCGHFKHAAVGNLNMGRSRYALWQSHIKRWRSVTVSLYFFLLTQVVRLDMVVNRYGRIDRTSSGLDDLVLHETLTPVNPKVATNRNTSRLYHFGLGSITFFSYFKLQNKQLVATNARGVGLSGGRFFYCFEYVSTPWLKQWRKQEHLKLLAR